MDVKYIRDGQTIDLPVLGRLHRFIISCSATSPPPAGANLVYAATQSTHVVLDSASAATATEPAVTTPPKDDTISYESIGGLAEQVHTVRDMVETSLKNPDLFRQYGK